MCIQIFTLAFVAVETDVRRTPYAKQARASADGAGNFRKTEALGDKGANVRGECGTVAQISDMTRSTGGIFRKNEMLE